MTTCCVEKFLHITFFLNRHCLWCLWQISGMVREAIAKKKSQSYGHFLLGHKQTGKSLKVAEKLGHVNLHLIYNTCGCTILSHVWLHNTITRLTRLRFSRSDNSGSCTCTCHEHKRSHQRCNILQIWFVKLNLRSVKYKFIYTQASLLSVYQGV